jgi:hypothetical protein
MGWGAGLAMAGALVALACGGSGSAGTPSGGSEVDTGLPANKSMADLTESEVSQFCAAMVELSASILPETCAFAGALSAAMEYSLVGTTDVATLRETCQTARDECLAPEQTSSSCEMPEACTATVGEVEACLNASVGQFMELVAQVPTCEELEPSDFEQQSSAEALATPPECTAIETSCPGLFQDESSSESGPDFTCSDGSTIPGYWVCDGMDDCADGEDEADC